MKCPIRAAVLTACAAALLLNAAAASARATPEQVGRQIEQAFNAQDTDILVQLIDLQALSREVMNDLGLSASQAAKLREGMRKSLRTNIEAGLRNFAQREGVAKFLRTGKQDGKTYSLVRIEYQAGDGGFDYLEYYVTPAGLIEDWYTHTRGSRASTSMRLAVSAMLDKGSMLASLFGVRSVDGQEVERFRAFSRHLAASDLPRAYQALEGLPEDYKRTKDWAMLRASIASYDEAAYRSSLEHLANNFADDSSVQFMLIDHYFYQQRFDQAYKAVTAFEAHVGEDGVTNFLKCSCLLGWKRYDDAVAACQRATAVESDFKSGYWGLITAGIESGNPKVTLAALSAYEKAFEVSFDPDVLAKTDPYRAIAGTPEFAAWARQRRSQN
jgi:hypothetical protein